MGSSCKLTDPWNQELGLGLELELKQAAHDLKSVIILSVWSIRACNGFAMYRLQDAEIYAKPRFYCGVWSDYTVNGWESFICNKTDYVQSVRVLTSA